MFDTFLKTYMSEDQIINDNKKEIDEFTSLITQLGGKSFGGGLYRVHSENSSSSWTEIVSTAFPQYLNSIICFGYDWLGRQFGVSRTNSSQIYLFEPGAGEVMNIPVGIAEFHNVDLVEYPNDAVSINFYDQWREHNNDELGLDKCVGYINPLFLGGADDLTNLEVSDMDVYWGICTQLMYKIRG